MGGSIRQFLGWAWRNVSRLAFAITGNVGGALVLLGLAVVMLGFGIAHWPQSSRDAGDISVFLSEPGIDINVSMQLTERAQYGAQPVRTDIVVQAERNDDAATPSAVALRPDVPLTRGVEPPSCPASARRTPAPPHSFVVLLGEGIRFDSQPPSSLTPSIAERRLGAHLSDQAHTKFGELRWSEFCDGRATAEVQFLNIDFNRPLVESTFLNLRRRIVLPRLYAPPPELQDQQVPGFPFREATARFHGPQAARFTVLAPPLAAGYETRRAVPVAKHLDPLTWEEERSADDASRPLSLGPDVMLERLDSVEYAGLLISLAATFFLIAIPALWRELIRAARSPHARTRRKGRSPWFALACVPLGALGIAWVIAGAQTWNAYERVHHELSGADAIIPAAGGGLALPSVTALSQVGQLDALNVYLVAAGRIEKSDAPDDDRPCRPGTQVNPGAPDLESKIGPCIGMGSIVGVAHQPSATELEQPAMVAGDLPEGEKEIAVGTTFARDRNVAVGDTLVLQFLPMGAGRAMKKGVFPVKALTREYDFTVTGIVLMPGDLRPPLGGGFRSVVLSRAFDDRYHGTLLSYPTHLVDLEREVTATELRRRLAGALRLAKETADVAGAPARASSTRAGASPLLPGGPAPDEATAAMKLIAESHGTPLQIYDKIHQRVRVDRFHRHLAWRTVLAGLLLCLAAAVAFAVPLRASRVNGWRLTFCAAGAAVVICAIAWVTLPDALLPPSMEDLARAGLLRPSWGWALPAALLTGAILWVIGYRQPRPAGASVRAGHVARWVVGLTTAVLIVAPTVGVSWWQHRLEDSVRNPLDYGAPWSFHLGYTFIGSIPDQVMRQIAESPGVREMSSGTLVDIEVCAEGTSQVLPFFALDRRQGELVPTLLDGKVPAADASPPGTSNPPPRREKLDPSRWPCTTQVDSGSWDGECASGMPEIMLGVGAAKTLKVDDLRECRIVMLTDSAGHGVPVRVTGIGSFPSLGETGWHGHAGFAGHRIVRTLFPKLASNFALVNVDPRFRRQFVHRIVATLGFGVPRDSSTAPPPERLAAANSRGEEVLLLTAALIAMLALGLFTRIPIIALIPWGVVLGLVVADFFWFVQRWRDGLDRGAGEMLWRALWWASAVVLTAMFYGAVVHARSAANAQRDIRSE